MRIDVREMTRRANVSEVALNDTRLALISEPLIKEFDEWSDPVRVRIDVRPDGLAEFVIQRVEVI